MLFMKIFKAYLNGQHYVAMFSKAGIMCVQANVLCIILALLLPTYIPKTLIRN